MSLQSSRVIAGITQAEVAQIGASPVGLTDLGFTAEQVAEADWLEITVGQPVYFRYDGATTPPTTSTGHYIAADVLNRLPPDGHAGGKAWMADLRFIAYDDPADFFCTLYCDVLPGEIATEPTYTTWEATVLEIDPTPPLLMMAFDEATGTVAENLGSLGAAANGTYVGGVTLAQAGPGGDNAILLNGTDGYVNILTDAFASALGPDATGFTVSFWVTAGADAGTNQDNPFLILQNGADGLAVIGFFDAGPVIDFETNNPSGGDENTGAVALPNSGLKVAYSFDFTHHAGFLSLNGGVPTAGSPSEDFVNNGDVINLAVLGAYGGDIPSLAYFLSGKLARFLFWNKALNGSQLAALTRL